MAILRRLPSRRYPLTFWILVGGLFFIITGMSMVWPFLPMYATSYLHLRLSQVGLLITVQAGAGIVGALSVGVLVDRWGRKPGLLLTLLGMALFNLGLVYTRTWLHMVGVMLLGGFSGHSYRVASDAMTADLLPPSERDQGYALLRVANNLGIALGPVLGGWAITHLSYQVTFMIAASVLLLYLLVVFVAVHETYSPQTISEARVAKGWFEDYHQMLRDGRLWRFLFPVFLAWMSVTLIWVYLGVYMRDAHHLAERYFGWVVSINALMVVIFQVPLTRWVRRLRAWHLAMVVGAALYAAALAWAAYARGFTDFVALMVVMTVGEMLLVPTASTWIANLAPAHLRGRYMASLALVWPVAGGLSAPIGGQVSERYSYTMLWLFGAAAALAAAILFIPQTPPPMGVEEQVSLEVG